MLPIEDAREFRSLDKLLSDWLLLLFELLEQAGTPNKTTAATSAPAITVRDRRSMLLF